MGRSEVTQQSNNGGAAASQPKTLDELTAGMTAWYSSNSEDIWTGGPYETREEAEDMAQGDEHCLIMRATKVPIRVSAFFDVDRFVESTEERLLDQGNEDGDPLLDFSGEVFADLQCRVRAAIDEWQVAHQLSPMPWAFFDNEGPMLAAWTTRAQDGE